MREPAFWWRQPGVAASMLAPLAAVYGMLVARRLARPGREVRVPVVCVGDPTVGGAGKTPTAIAIACLLARAGERPVFLTRGYGGREAGPLRVDPQRHRAVDVGDEPLLLAAVAPAIVARDRVDGAAAAVTAGASVIVMDDGFQNPALAKDFALLVVDAGRGIGNGLVTPAGPLRAPFAAQLERADAVLVIGTAGAAADAIAQARSRQVPVFTGRLWPDDGFVARNRGRRVLAFAGIGSPEKFFATLDAAGVTVAAQRGYPDHHRYSRADAARLCADAERQGLALVTTEKDLVRMRGDSEVAALTERAQALPVSLVLDDAPRFGSLLGDRLATARAARPRA